MSAAKFYWAIVGDASPEPVAVVEENGRRVAYTCGCADPFVVDGEGANITLLADPGGYRFNGKINARSDYWVDVDERPFSMTDEDKEALTPKPLTPPPKPSERAKQRAEAERRLEAYRKRGIRHGHRRFNP